MCQVRQELTRTFVIQLSVSRLNEVPFCITRRRIHRVRSAWVFSRLSCPGKGHVDVKQQAQQRTTQPCNSSTTLSIRKETSSVPRKVGQGPRVQGSRKTRKKGYRSGSQSRRLFLTSGRGTPSTRTAVPRKPPPFKEVMPPGTRAWGAQRVVTNHLGSPARSRVTLSILPSM